MKLNFVSSGAALPSAWDPRAGVSRLPVSSIFKVDGLRVRYVGPENPEAAAAVRANCTVPLNCPLYYFEIEVVGCRHDCSICIGFSPEDYSLSKYPYYGYHGGDGSHYQGPLPVPYGPSFGAGDVIGAMLNRSDRSITFYKNGVELGVAVSGIDDEQLYPSVGVRSKDDELVANFGGSSFKLDLAALTNDIMTQSMAEIATSELSAVAASGTLLLPQIVLDYLIHYRCWNTVSAMTTDLAPCSTVDDVLICDMQNRQTVYDAILQGDIDSALQLIQKQYPPSVLQKNPGTLFKLRCQKFVELLQKGNGDCQAALEYAQAELTSIPQTTEEIDLRGDALSLLAYAQPESSPSAYLLSPNHKRSLAEEVNGLLLESIGRRKRPALEMCYRQAAICLEELKRVNNVKSCAVDNVTNVLQIN